MIPWVHKVIFISSWHWCLSLLYKLLVLNWYEQFKLQIEITCYFSIAETCPIYYMFFPSLLKYTVRSKIVRYKLPFRWSCPVSHCISLWPNLAPRWPVLSLLWLAFYRYNSKRTLLRLTLVFFLLLFWRLVWIQSIELVKIACVHTYRISESLRARRRWANAPFISSHVDNDERYFIWLFKRTQRRLNSISMEFCDRFD